MRQPKINLQIISKFDQPVYHAMAYFKTNTVKLCRHNIAWTTNNNAHIDFGTFVK